MGKSLLNTFSNLEYVCDNLLNGGNLEADSPIIRKFRVILCIVQKR